MVTPVAVVGASGRLGALVAAVVEDCAGETDGVAGGGSGRDGASCAGATVHDRGVKLQCAVMREDRAAPRVEVRVVLQHAHRRLDRVERAAAVRQHLRPDVERP